MMALFLKSQFLASCYFYFFINVLINVSRLGDLSLFADDTNLFISHKKVF